MSLPCVDPIQRAAPIEDSPIRCRQALSLQRSCHDQPVGRIPMEIREARGPNANLSVNGNLHQALSK